VVLVDRQPADFPVGRTGTVVSMNRVLTPSNQFWCVVVRWDDNVEPKESHIDPLIWECLLEQIPL